MNKNQPTVLIDGQPTAISTELKEVVITNQFAIDGTPVNTVAKKVYRNARYAKQARENPMQLFEKSPGVFCVFGEGEGNEY